MKFRNITILTAALALLLIAFAGVQATNMFAEPTAVAVVDIQKVFDGLKERVSLDAEDKTSREALQQEAKLRQEEIQALQEELKMLEGQAGTDQKQDELQMKAIQYQAWGKFMQQKQASDAALNIEQLYRKMLKAIDLVATEGGYELVLYKETIDRMNTADIQQLRLQIFSRKVLYNSPTIDLTNQVIQRMNNQYDNAR
ncbi:OmpH family outer membrane protein [Poriferisphaera sp. WC338]|uniref:OmpH family outer membrane protein n=1 Tax=Poriferisphaera sp. WC338 TaxID=3425129 RepID=UPI003D8169CF